MRNRRRFGSLLFLTLLLTGCGGQEGTSLSETTVNTAPISEVSSEEAASSSSKENVTYRWDKNTDKLLTESLGEYVSHVPVLNALYYDSANVTAEDGSYTYTMIGCVGDDSETMMKMYKATLTLNGFKVTYSESSKSYGTYARMDFSHLLLITYMDMQDAGSTDSGVVICTWIYEDKTTTFPMDIVQSVVSDTIPVPEAQYYQGQLVTGYGTPLALCNCYGTTAEQTTAYADELRKAGFEEDTATGVVYGGANFNHPSKNIMVVYYYYTAEQAAEEGFEGDMPVLQMMVYDSTPSDHA